MKLATLRVAAVSGPGITADPTRAVLLHGDRLLDLGDPDLGTFLSRPDWRERAVAVASAGAGADVGLDVSLDVDANVDACTAGTATKSYAVAEADFAPPVPQPSKIVCVGLNYRNHILEMGRELPLYPTLFAKFADCLVGAHDEIVKPDETEALDWEAELALVIGRPIRRARGAEAAAAIAGFTILNDLTCRDWQYRTGQWLQGKAWDACTPVGPYVVTPDELPGGVRPELAIGLDVDGMTMQADSTADLLFDPVALVEYVSTMVRLNPGDIIATGTPGGVGHARKPAQHLVDGAEIVTRIEGIGVLRNRIVVP